MPISTSATAMVKISATTKRRAIVSDNHCRSVELMASHSQSIQLPRAAASDCPAPIRLGHDAYTCDDIDRLRFPGNLLSTHKGPLKHAFCSVRYACQRLEWF